MRLQELVIGTCDRACWMIQKEERANDQREELQKLGQIASPAAGVQLEGVDRGWSN